jgi:hypothetical protein
MIPTTHPSANPGEAHKDVATATVPTEALRLAFDHACRMPSETGEGQQVWDPPGCWWV